MFPNKIVDWELPEEGGVRQFSGEVVGDIEGYEVLEAEAKRMFRFLVSVLWDRLTIPSLSSPKKSTGMSPLRAKESCM